MSYLSLDVVSVIAIPYEIEILSVILKMTSQVDFCRMEQIG
jgi:hypothetical protein